MFKSILTAAAITMATLAPAQAGVVEQCSKVADLHKIMAEARDRGVSASTAINLLVSNGMSEGIALSVVRTVYITAANEDPETLRIVALGACIEAMTN